LFRTNWRDPRFWKWWWQHRVTLGTRIAVGALLLALLVVGGWFGSVYLTTASAGGSADSYVLETTIKRVVTVREKGKVIRKVVPQVRRVVVPSLETRYDTKVVTVKGERRIVRQPVIRYVPRVRDRLVTVKGRTRTVSETRLVPTTTVRMRTQTATATVEYTVTATQTQTRTNERTVTNTDTRYRTTTETRTVTETSPPVTVTTTETVPPVTVTVLVTTTVKH
jgi:hypothetical protein